LPESKLVPSIRSGGCDANDTISPDGTLALRASTSCSVRRWPKLGRSR
jgi:hypothetical protein